MEKLNHSRFLSAFEAAVRAYVKSNERDLKILTKRGVFKSRDPHVIYSALIGGTSRDAFDTGVSFGLVPECFRHGGGMDNSVSSTIELAAIMSTWGALNALQVMALQVYLGHAWVWYQTVGYPLSKGGY